jgi:aspartyl-tRNA synthetase
MMRTHEAGALRREHAGEHVTLAGWVARRRDHGGVIFVDLRDASGVVQVVFRQEDEHLLRAESCVRVDGEVRARPEGNENPELSTGDVEVVATSLKVLSEAAPLPFGLADRSEASEDLRLRYRYLDLRRSGPAAALRLRSEANRIARRVMAEHDFVEVETPTLTRSTPEGARDFLVPVRLQPGHWYALPQSPQLFKQLLMVAGLERYFQFARCYRDEDFRADRQPEFTQLDVEMSFVEADDVLAVGEAVLSALWRELAGYDVPLPIPRLSYADAMARFGSDKPDLRFSCELVELTPYFAGTSFRVFQAPYVGAVVLPGGASQSRRDLDAWQDWARARGAPGLAYVLVGEGGELSGPVARNLSDAERSGLAEEVGARAGDCVFFAAGERASSQALLGAARLDIGRRCGLVDANRWEFVWVVDFPMFERDSDGGWTATHHPFTAPRPEWEQTFQDKPADALASAYDIVCNGSEIGSGSIRIHRAEMQQRVFDVIGLSEDEARAKFGFLLDAFAFGPPPHGGIAPGWDRICMLLAGADSIRDVIAFPKTASGYDPLTGAPTPITPSQRKEAGIDARPAGRQAGGSTSANRPGGGSGGPPNKPGGETLPDERRS